MANPTFDSFSLNDSHYITSEIEYRTIPNRELAMESISRKPGRKLISQEFAERHIRLSGWILGDDASDLLDKINDLHENVTRKDSGTLSVDTDKEIAATVASVAVMDPHYTQSMIPMDIEFIAVDPFFQGTQQTVTLDVPVGPKYQNITLTVSGSVFAEPTVTYTAPAGTGSTPTENIIVEYLSTAETVTWSGGGTPLQYAEAVQFDYANQLILLDGGSEDISGVFSRWEPGSRNIKITYGITTTSTTTTSTSSTTTSTSTTTTTSTSTSTSITTSTSTSTSTSTTVTGTTTSTSITTTSTSTTTTTSTSTSTTTSTTTSTSTSTTTTLAANAGGTIAISYRPRYL